MNLKSTLKAIKLNESTISMVLGAIVVIVVGILVINYFRSSEEGETIPSVNVEQLPPLTHKVQEGEDLWTISEKYYQTGYNWVEIAQENNLSNPGEIEVGQELIIPEVTPKLAAKPPSPSPEQIPTTMPETDKSKNATHVVQKGESLWKIALNYYQDAYQWTKIAQENNVEPPYVIEEGTSLRMPEVILSKSADIENSISGSSYTVKEGDSLWDICIRAYGNGYKWVEIAQENDLANPDLIHPGNQLALPR